MEPRETVLRRLAEGQFDLLVIGGGITGAGIALDAAARGMRVALVEQSDFAAGTSSRSTKLVHGGVRYLAQRDIALVREALAERDLLLRLAPHLVQPQPFVLPVYRGQHVSGVPAPSMATPLLTSMGLAAYDLLAGRRNLQGHHGLTALGARGLVPSLRTEGLRGAFLYYDARTDDVRLTLAVLQTAVARDAVAANYAEVTGFTARNGRLTDATVRDRIGGGEVTVRAARVVGATGAWSARLAALADNAVGGPSRADGRDRHNGHGGRQTPRGLRLSKGVHLVIDRDSVPLGALAVVLPTTADGRLAFVVPWGTQMLLGTTDTPYDGDPAAVRPEPADVDTLLDDANRYLDLGLDRSDIVGAFAGLRPLVQSDAASTATTSREHAVAVAPSGLVSVTGGKLTTYRRMARDTVDAALRTQPGPWGASTTARVPLAGAAGLSARSSAARGVARELGLPTDVATHLVASYGAEAPGVLSLVAERPELGRRLVEGQPYLAAEIVYGVRHEGAQRLDDVLQRRTRLALEVADGAASIAPAVADLLGVELGWNEETRRRAVEDYRAEAATAHAAWTTVPDTTSGVGTAGARGR